MSKEFTNRQLAEALGYALEKAEKNIKQSVDSLESERKRIESFKVDTDSAEGLFKDANEAFRQTSNKCVSKLEKAQNAKPKWAQVKDWILIGALFLLAVINGGLAISFYYKQSKVEEEKEEISNVAKNLVRFFEENPKQKEVFDKWNK